MQPFTELPVVCSTAACTTVQRGKMRSSAARVPTFHSSGEEGEAANRVNPEIEGRDFARGDGKSADEGRSKHVDHVTAV
jgi:hypothetical protein